MAETWDKIQRQVLLRSNQLQADTAASLAANYVVPDIGDTEMGDRATEFPKVAVDDAILNAADRLVGMIGMDKNSPFRNYFAGVTSNVASGAVIPAVSSFAKNRVGVIGDVRDSATGKKLVAKEYQDVIGIPNMTIMCEPHWYYTDNVRIWHTRTNVVIDIVTWDKLDQLSAMADNPRGDCPFPEELHEALVCGALSYIFRGDFNTGQVEIWRKYFEETLADMSVKNSAEVNERKLDE